MYDQLSHEEYDQQEPWKIKYRKSDLNGTQLLKVNTKWKKNIELIKKITSEEKGDIAISKELRLKKWRSNPNNINY